jgi:hypothetical protein
MAKNYRWRKGSRYKSDPQAVGELLEALADANAGIVTATMLVDAARDPNSPVHIDMTWDNEEAAELLRQNQARNIMGGLVITTVVIATDDSILNDPNYKPQVGSIERPIRAWPHIAMDGGYVSISRVLTDEDRKIAWLSEALRDYRRLQKRYDGIQELCKIFDETDRLAELLG